MLFARRIDRARPAVIWATIALLVAFVLIEASHRHSAWAARTVAPVAAGAGDVVPGPGDCIACRTAAAGWATLIPAAKIASPKPSIDPHGRIAATLPVDARFPSARCTRAPPAASIDLVT